MPQTLSRDEVRHIAALAQLALTHDEVEALRRQLASILEYAQQILELDTAGVEPTSHVTATSPGDRDDAPRPSLTRDDALANAPDARPSAGLFRVPRVLG
jgi:aspartyl-tRNA(Asn)/glutamyl-tRNA(Gln) amidotransferase subunit C